MGHKKKNHYASHIWLMAHVNADVNYKNEKMFHVKVTTLWKFCSYIYITWRLPMLIWAKILLTSPNWNGKMWCWSSSIAITCILETSSKAWYSVRTLDCMSVAENLDLWNISRSKYNKIIIPSCHDKATGNIFSLPL